jgi:uncharacterized protein with HEPN domain
MLESIQVIQDYTSGMDYDTFIADRRTVDAVIRNLNIIGEAATHVPDEITEQYPEIPWAEMRGMRNIVVHVYFGVNLRIVWDTLQVNLPPLVTLLKRLL